MDRTIDSGGGRRLARRHCALLATAVLGLAGCEAPPASDALSVLGPRAVVSSEDGGPSTLTVAADLVSALVQVDGYSPHDTTVQINRPTSGFGASLVAALEAAGYGLQLVSADQGSNYLSYSAASEETETGRQISLELRLRKVAIGRRVTIVGGRYVPVAPLEIRGVAPQPVALNGSIYLDRPDRPLSYPSGVRFVEGTRDTRGSAVLAEALHRYSYWPTGAGRTGAADDEALDPLRFVPQAAARLYDSGDRAFSTRPAADFRIRQSVALRFPTSSDAMLGAANRGALERLVRLFVPSADRVSVASCSPSGTRTDSSVARSGRVKAELLTLGVPGDQVVEIGCPAANRRSTAAPELDVTLERLIDS